MPARPQKITFAEMRASGVRGLLIYCSDYHCSHWIAISGDRWPGEIRPFDLEPGFLLFLRSSKAPPSRSPPGRNQALTGQCRAVGLALLLGNDQWCQMVV
jgi:hypothetical protein